MKNKIKKYLTINKRHYKKQIIKYIKMYVENKC